jgi:hypothetical protein
MSKKRNRALRRYNTYIKALRQQKLYQIQRFDNHVLPLGYFKKHNAMDCGNPKCGICGNPRKSRMYQGTKVKKLTLQELKNNINCQDF